MRIQQQQQLSRKLWWEEEELSEEESVEALADYCLAKPAVVVSHTCPRSIAKFVLQDTARSAPLQPADINTRTHELLQAMYETHRPRFWYFGHFHHDWEYREEGVEFRCVGELSYLDLDEMGAPLGRRH